jgi:hypothetical protein
VIDIRDNIGGVNIYKKDSGDFVDMVGMEKYGYMIIISWESK